tara:strand:- start:84 stop:251 length:168 start_codon:yes stop_codon:yes gene_type:complete
MADNYQKALKKLYIMTITKKLESFENHLKENKYTYSFLLWFIILIGFGIYYADRL